MPSDPGCPLSPDATCAGTIEDKIIEVQNRKRGMIDSTLTDKGKEEKMKTYEEILNMFDE